MVPSLVTRPSKPDRVRGDVEAVAVLVAQEGEDAELDRPASHLAELLAEARATMYHNVPGLPMLY